MAQLKESVSVNNQTAENQIDPCSLRDSMLDGDREQRDRGSFVDHYPSGDASVHPCEIRDVEGPSPQFGYTRSGQDQDVLRDFTIRLINAQEEERSWVARELHDDLNQRMALLSIRLGQIVEMIHGPSIIRRDLQVVQRDAQEISADIHRLCYKLHPSKLVHLGLGAAIGGLCQEINATGKPAVKFHQEGSLLNLPKDVTLCVFRITQESLQNCAKYSGAKLARVTLVNTGKAVGLSVSDDGCGFELKPEVMERGLGFTSMRERVRVVGGIIAIRSQPARGTSIEVSIPLSGDCFD